MVREMVINCSLVAFAVMTAVVAGALAFMAYDYVRQACIRRAIRAEDYER